MKKRINNKFLRYFVIPFFAIFIIANGIIWLSDNTYIYKALIYQQVGIDDLDIFENREIKTGEIKSEWKISSTYNQTKLSDSLTNMLVKNKSVAFLVITNDSIQYEQYWDGYSQNSLSNSFSMAKSFVSLLVGIAIEEGKIKGVDQKVSDFLPEFAEGEKAKITIRHLLTMSSGLNFMESYSSPFNFTTEAYYGNDLPKMVNKLEVIEEPGSIDRYKSGDPQILELILKKATGMNISEYLSKKVWAKMEAMNSAQWSLDREGGDEKAYCCIYSNARDFARIGKVYLNNGCWDTTRIVSEDWIKNSITPNLLPAEKGGISTNYGWQWWIMDRNNTHVFYMRGLLGQYVLCIPEKNMIIVRLGHERPTEKVDGHPIDVVTFVEESIKLF